MSVLTLLTTLKETESKFGRLYQWFSELFTSDPEASLFLYHLALEEFAHASLAGFAIRLVSQKSSLAGPVELELGEIQEASKRMDGVLHGPPPDIAQAFRIAIDLECYVFEYKMRSALAEAIPECGYLFNRLKVADQMHHQQLVEFAILRQYIPPISG